MTDDKKYSGTGCVPPSGGASKGRRASGVELTEVSLLVDTARP